MIQVTTVSYGRVRGRAKQYPYWQACLYEFRPRKSDGKMTAWLVGTIGAAYRSEAKATLDAVNYAQANNILYHSCVRQYTPLKKVLSNVN